MVLQLGDKKISFLFSVVEGYFYIVHKSKHLTVNNGQQPGNDW